MTSESTSVETLVAIEDIKRLKAAYFRLMDARDWTAWGDVLTADCIMVLDGSPPHVIEGREAIVASAKGSLTPRVGMHLGHMPEIEIDSASSATGRWALLAFSTTRPEDGHVAPPGMLSLGTYDDRYLRGPDGRWRIAHTLLRTTLRLVGEGADQTLGPTDGVLVRTS